MKVFSALRNHPFIFSFILLVTAFCFSHLPFFLWMDLPEVLPDTFDYFNVTDILWHRHFVDLAIQPLEMPLGYPLFLLLTSAIGCKLITIVFLQSLIHLLACVYLAFVCCKYYKQVGVLVAAALSIYLMNGYTIRWDTALYSESLYSSSLTILAGVFIGAINKNSLSSFCWLGVWLFVPEFLRPNGIYVYYIIPLLFIYFFVHKEKMVKYFSIFIPALLLNLAWAGFNTKAYGAFIPGNFIRFRAIHLKSVTGITPPKIPYSYNNPSPIGRLEIYTQLHGYGQFYYDFWADRYVSMYQQNQVQDTAYKMYDWTTPIPDSIRRLVYKEYYGPTNRFSAIYLNVKSQGGWKGAWMKAYQGWYKIDYYIFRNPVLPFLFFLLSIFAIYKWIATGFRDRVLLVFTGVACVHILGILTVTFTHSSSQWRYSQVSEFIIYVIFALTPLLYTGGKGKLKYA